VASSLAAAAAVSFPASWDVLVPQMRQHAKAERGRREREREGGGGGGDDQTKRYYRDIRSYFIKDTFKFNLRCARDWRVNKRLIGI